MSHFSQDPVLPVALGLGVWFLERPSRVSRATPECFERLELRGLRVGDAQVRLGRVRRVRVRWIRIEITRCAYRCTQECRLKGKHACSLDSEQPLVFVKACGRENHLCTRDTRSRVLRNLKWIRGAAVGSTCIVSLSMLV